MLESNRNTTLEYATMHRLGLGIVLVNIDNKCMLTHTRRLQAAANETLARCPTSFCAHLKQFACR